ncbi:MAG: non-homologous end-joining DNA ligase [Planctomycetes bacterium]|nr:non-homologous end-joining DNA ligase [Planctomycetota bacterium]
MSARPTDDYERRRDFARTPEPRASAKRQRRGARAEFVVQRHDASRLHYDLRLEIGGTLASWAVPRGFSYDPKEKRLAIRTEDHPLGYLDFEGVIPEGEYGAGTMQIWDRGTYHCVDAEHMPADPADSVAGGELKVVLGGRRLRGEWHLVKTKQAENSWLLFKSRDRYAASASRRGVDMDLGAAKPSPMPKRPRHVAIADAREPFSDPDYVFELEFDGRPTFALVEAGHVRLSGVDDARAESLCADLAELRGESAVVDGTLVVRDSDGRPSFAALSARLAGDSDATLEFYAHDLLHYEGLDLRNLPLVERKAALGRILPASDTVHFVDHVVADGERLAETVAAAGLGAIVARRADGDYLHGVRCRVRVEPHAKSGDLDAALRALHGGATVPTVTNPGKTFWPDDGLTKGDLCAYYAAVADTILPHLVDRPIHLHRFPDGIGGESFYQHKPSEGAPAWLHSEEIDGAAHIFCDDLRHLIYLVNLASIDLHPWMSRRHSLEHPDWLVLDLDPKDAPFADVVAIARAAHELLADLGLRSWLKTSGKTGLHVYVPLEPVYSYDQARLFAEGVARYLAHRHAKIATVERAVQRRGSRVYVDFGQNRRGQTVVAPYVVRPVPGATVSAPLPWDELDGLDPRAFTMKSMPRRIAEHGDLFRGVLDEPQELLPAIEALRGLMG